MNDFDTLIQEQLARPGVAREYYRLAPFYRLADQLILLRKKRGLTQQELAEQAQTTQAVVSRLENASVRCSLETAVRLAEALDAVVEVTIRPLEELSTPAEEPCTEAAKEEKPSAVVYFNPAQKAPCSPNVFYAIDPLTGQMKSPAQIKRKKTLEIA